MEGMIFCPRDLHASDSVGRMIRRWKGNNGKKGKGKGRYVFQRTGYSRPAWKSVFDWKTPHPMGISRKTNMATLKKGRKGNPTREGENA